MSRVDKGRPRAPAVKPGSVNPILEAWKAVNKGRPVPPQLLTDPRAAGAAEARQQRTADWKDTWA